VASDEWQVTTEDEAGFVALPSGFVRVLILWNGSGSKKNWRGARLGRRAEAARFGLQGGGRKASRQAVPEARTAGT